MSRYRRYEPYVPVPLVPYVSLVIPNYSISHEMLQHECVWPNNILGKSIGLDLIHPSFIQWIQDQVEAVTTGDIVDGAVTGPKIADDSITDPKIAAGAIDDYHMGNDCVTERILGSDAVTTSKIKDSNVTLSKMATNSVDSQQIINSAIDAAHFSDDAKTAFVKPSFTDIVASIETGTITQTEGKKFIPLGEILVGPKAILLALTVTAPSGAAYTGTVNIYGSGLSDLTGLKKEAVIIAKNYYQLQICESIVEFPLPAIISLVHCPVAPTGAEEYSGIVLEITAATAPGTVFTYSIGPYGILDGALVES